MVASGYVDDTDLYGGLLTDFLEFVPDLQWPTSVSTYSRMRRDPQLTAILAAHMLPIRRATITVDGAGCRSEVTQLVADDLGLPIAGKDEEPGPARRRGVVFPTHLRMAGLSLVYGHMPFELSVDPNVEGRTRLTGLYERMPHTISEIDVDTSTGALNGIRQREVTKTGSKPPLLAADRLAMYSHEKEGTAWQGTSIFRPGFGPWLLKHEMWRVHATSNRRTGMGIPVARALPGTTPSPGQMAEAAVMAQQYRAGDQAGGALPPGFVLDLQGITGTLPDTLTFIRYLDQQMSRMVLAGMLDLGDTPNGSRALGSEFVDLFMLSLQATADEFAETITRDVSVRLVDLNWGEDEPAPRVVIADVGSDHSVTAEALKMLHDAGVLTADPALEEYIRKTWRLPEKEDVPPPPNLPTPPTPPGGAVDPVTGLPISLPPLATPPTIAAARGRLRRQPTKVELAAKTNFQQVAADLDHALDQLEQAWKQEVTEVQASALRDAVEAALKNGDEAALSKITLPTTKAKALLKAAMEKLAAEAADAMHEEAWEQGVTALPDEPKPDHGRLTRVAAATAALLAGGLAAYGARQALQRWRPDGLGAAVVADEVHDALHTLTGASLRDGLMAAMQTAVNEGRLAVLREAPQGRYFASEILDGNECQPCADIDGTEFANLAAAEDAYAAGGFYACDGGARCRGIIVATFDGDEQVAARRARWTT